MRIRFLALLLLLAGGGSAAAQARFQWAAPGECPTEHWQLTEMWRLGPESDPLTYGTVAIERDREGRVYLLNAVLGQIQVYDAQGRYLHALMRKGEGPGEVENPLDFCLMADGNICVMEAFPGELIVITGPAGTFAPCVRRSRRTAWIPSACSGRSFMRARICSSRKARRRSWARRRWKRSMESGG
jgi:hypothetical protein